MYVLEIQNNEQKQEIESWMEKYKYLEKGHRVHVDELKK